jgi:hypothetical protein
MEWLAPFPATEAGAKLPIGDARALVQRGWWTVLAMYHAQLDEAAQELIRGYLRQHLRTTESARLWCEARQLPLALVPGYALLTPGAGVMKAQPHSPKNKRERSGLGYEPSPGSWLDLYMMPVPHLWRSGEAWTDGGDDHIARFGKTRVYLLEQESSAPA